MKIEEVLKKCFENKILVHYSDKTKDILNNFRNVNEQKPSYIDLKLFQ